MEPPDLRVGVEILFFTRSLEVVYSVVCGVMGRGCKA